MKCLLVYSHPNPASFNHAILEEVSKTLKAAGHEVVLRDLYALKFNPVLSPSDFGQLAAGKMPPDVAEEQKHITWADTLVFIHPIWWAGLPAMMKGYIDRVFLKGFAYDAGKEGIIPLLKGKKVVIFNTTGTPSEIYEKSGMFRSMNQPVESGIHGFCGLEVVLHHYFGGVPYVDDAARKRMLAQVPELLKGI